MIPLLLFLEIRKAAICHCQSNLVLQLVWQKEKWRKTTSKYTAKRKSSFLLSTFLRGSSTKATQLPIFFCLKEWNKTVFNVWFYVLMKSSSKTMVFLDHQNECRPALRVEVSCLCNGDSNFNHVPLNSPSIPRLAGIHQKTITMHSRGKRGDVVRRSGSVR
jgi:hypothetical protein